MEIILLLLAFAIIISIIINIVLLIIKVIVKKPIKNIKKNLLISFTAFIVLLFLVPKISNESEIQPNENIVASSSESQILITTKETTTKETTIKVTTETKLSESEIFIKDIIENATQIDFVEINGHESEHEGEPYYLTGEVGPIFKTSLVDGVEMPIPSFFISTNEGDGHGVYELVDVGYNTDKLSIKQGDIIKAYIKVYGKNANTGAPQLFLHYVEKQ